MNIRESYNEWAESYDSDRNLTRDLDGEVTRKLLAGPAVGGILEIGCGTGKNTAFLAEIGTAVHALDFSESMIALARAKPGLERVQFTVADLTTPWPVGNRSVELVVCNLVLEHVRDLAFVFSEAFRVLVPGGRFFVCELHPFRQYQGTVAVFQRDGNTTGIAAHVHHLSEFLAAAEAAGFALQQLNEWWHAEDRDKPPRLASLIFEKG